MMFPLLLPVAFLQLKAIWEENVERIEITESAEQYSRSVGKPMLIIGRPKGKHTSGNPYHGDVCIDLDPEVLVECPYTGMVADIEKPLPFKDNYFGASCYMHVLEHLNDPFSSLDEVGRVSDYVFIAYPKLYNPFNYIHPDHKWLITPYGRQIRFQKMR